MGTSERQILNLLHRYAECVDDGDFDAVGALFEHSDYDTVGQQGPPLRGVGVARAQRSLVRTYEGSPRTKHVITNAIIDIDEDAGTATSRSYFTVLQAAPGLALQPIITGRYHDRFESVDGVWRFADRRIIVEQMGDLSAHLAPGTL